MSNFTFFSKLNMCLQKKPSVSPDPDVTVLVGSYPRGLLTRRKAWFSPNCLATEPRPHLASFSTASAVAGGMAGLVADLAPGSFLMQVTSCSAA